jgi:hypothetical protein
LPGVEPAACPPAGRSTTHFVVGVFAAALVPYEVHAIGAILRFATHFHVKGLDLRTIGLILMIASVVGLVIAIWQWAVWSRRSRRAEVLVDDRRAVDPEYRDLPPR